MVNPSFLVPLSSTAISVGSIVTFGFRSHCISVVANAIIAVATMTSKIVPRCSMTQGGMEERRDTTRSRNMIRHDLSAYLNTAEIYQNRGDSELYSRTISGSRYVLKIGKECGMAPKELVR